MSDQPVQSGSSDAPAPARQHGFTRREYILLSWGFFGALGVVIVVSLLQSKFKELYARHALTKYQTMTSLEVVEAMRIVSDETSVGELRQLRKSGDSAVPALFIDLATGREGAEGEAELRTALDAGPTGNTLIHILAGLEYARPGAMESRIADRAAPPSDWMNAVHAAALVDAYTAVDFGREITGHYICLFPGRKEIDTKVLTDFENGLNRLLAEQDEQTDPASGTLLTKTQQAKDFLAAQLAAHPEIYKSRARAKWQGKFESFVLRRFERRDVSLRYKQHVRAYVLYNRSRLTEKNWAVINRYLSERYLNNPVDLAPPAGSSAPADGAVRAHVGPVLAIAASPPDGRLATAGFDNLVKIWPAEGSAGAPPRVLAGHDYGVMAVAWSADGQRLASCGLDETIRIWDPASGREIGRFPAATKRVSAIAFAPGGKLLAAAGPKSTTRLLDSDTGTEVKVLVGLKGEATALAFSPGGRYIAAASRDKTVRVWDLRGGSDGADQPAAKLPEKINSFTLKHNDVVTDLEISPDGRTLASTSMDWVSRSFDLRQEPTKPRTMKAHRSPVTAVAWSPDSQLCATVGLEGRVIVWSPTSGEVATMHRMNAVVNALAFSRDGKTIHAAGDDGAVHSWTVQLGQIESRTLSEWVVDTFSRIQD